MAYIGKTNWIANEIVNPVDMNRIEQGITNNDTNKANKVSGGTTGNLTKLTSNGDIADSGKKLSDLLLTTDFMAHVESDVNTENGAHNIRYFDDSLQFYNGTSWIDIQTAGVGFAPADCTNMSITQGNTTLTISWTDPQDAYYEGVALSIWAGTKLVRKVGSYPVGPDDGTLVVNSTVRDAYSINGFVDSGVVDGTIYYYALFPYSDKNQINTFENAKASKMALTYKVFGVKIDIANSNPETSCTYLDDAIGMSTGHDAWKNTAIFRYIKPCLVKDGVVQYYLNPDNLAYQVDGTSAATINSTTAGDVMIEIPKLGYKMTTDGTYHYIWVTNNPAADGYCYRAHALDAEGDCDKIYIGAYLGYAEGEVGFTKLYSISGKTPVTNGDLSDFRLYAQARGTGYQLASFYPLTLLQCLYLIKYKNRNGQAALGYGYVGGAIKQNTGGANAAGTDYGNTSSATDAKRMCFLNIEDFWGNLCWWIDGIYVDASYNIKTAFKSFSDTGSGYAYSKASGISSSKGGYMSDIQGTNEGGFVLKAIAGSSTTYYADDAVLAASKCGFFGGTWSNLDSAGPFRFNIYYAASFTGSDVGARLMYKHKAV